MSDIKNDFLHLDVSSKVEKKSGLSYLSWPYAWGEVLKAKPTANYEVLKFDNNLPYVYDHKTGYMVFTTATVDGVTREMWLLVMDGANKAMKAEPYDYTTKYGTKTVQAASMFDINKAIMRCLVKNFAMFGLGLYIYAGEDLPEESEEVKAEKIEASKPELSEKNKEAWSNVVTALKGDFTIEQVKGKYRLSKENEDKLLKK